MQPIQISARYKRAFFGQSALNIGFDNVACVGNESSLLDCPRFGNISLYSNNCDHSEDAGVSCVDPYAVSTDSFQIRLFNGTQDSTSAGFGRVQILAPTLAMDGPTASDPANWVWQTVCDDGFDDDDAAVVCRSVGLQGGTAVKNAVYVGTGLVQVC